MTKYEAVRQDFESALTRLREVLAIEKTSITRDSAIQRFEFTVDLAWKTIKTYLEEKKGVRCTSPKGCIQDAFQNGIIVYDEYWLEMIDLRNETSHTYKEALAEEVFAQLPKAAEYCGKLLTNMVE